jgi:Protein of unknown function (DUF664)
VVVPDAGRGRGVGASVLLRRRSEPGFLAAVSFDDIGIRFATGEPIALRRIVEHMLAEYARHNGHADLLRERIDGG